MRKKNLTMKKPNNTYKSKKGILDLNIIRNKYILRYELINAM